MMRKFGYGSVPAAKSFTLRKKLLAGDNVNDAFAAILAKLSTV